nr:cold-inducible RNA-binding protein [Ipomoea batatas]
MVACFFDSLRDLREISANQGLSFYTTNEELRRLFLPFGDIKEARLVIDHRTQRPKGFGFVTFESETDAQNALKALNGKIINGRLIFVEVAKTTRPGES